MGYAYEEYIENAAKYLLSVLETREFVDYSTFFDGTDETAERLRQAVEGDKVGHSQSPELMMDIAVDQLMEQGIVESTLLETRLVDAEPDYRISWAEGGREKLKSEKLSFYGVVV